MQPCKILFVQDLPLKYYLFTSIFYSDTLNSNFNNLTHQNSWFTNFLSRLSIFRPWVLTCHCWPEVYKVLLFFDKNIEKCTVFTSWSQQSARDWRNFPTLQQNILGTLAHSLMVYPLTLCSCNNFFSLAIETSVSIYTTWNTLLWRYYGAFA